MMEESMIEDSQFTQNNIPPGQKILEESREKKLEDAKKAYNDKLLVKNNGLNGDEGVRMTILALEDKAKAMKELKMIRKESLAAAMGFLCDISLEEAKNKCKDILVDDLRQQIIEIYEMNSPIDCRQCKTIFNTKRRTVGSYI